MMKGEYNRRVNKKLFFIYILSIIVLFGLGTYLLNTNKQKMPLPVLMPSKNIPSTSAPEASQSAEIVTVKRVVDGDTIELIDGRKVRYIGIDTPELHHPTKKVQCFGQEAMIKNKELVEGKTIKMIKDVSDVDRYKRLLRYIYVGDVFVNEYLAREGYASQSTFPPDVKYAELFLTAAEDAREKNKGLWKACK